MKKPSKIRLSPEERRVMLEKGTEPAFSGSLLHNKESGVYSCKACGSPLFLSDAKFDSGTGWPSFWDAENVRKIPEGMDAGGIFSSRHGMRRTEVVCAGCGAHLGHVFDDGPKSVESFGKKMKATGLRYCINSVSLDFQKTEKAVFAAGCFWHVEEAFRKLRGVLTTRVGYMGGTDKKSPSGDMLINPTYKEVCTGKTGHAESVLVEYDPKKISYEKLLDTFWKIHDPTQQGTVAKGDLSSWQGVDIGTQYRSVIFYYNEAQRKAAEAALKQFVSLRKLSVQSRMSARIVTVIKPASVFWPAEEYHQCYFMKKQNAG